MIRLITGLPGAGKTLRAIEYGMELKGQGKNVYYLDINGLDETKTGFVPFPAELRDWAATLVAGDVLIVDEVQRFLPAITRRDAVTPWIEALTRNRHLGIDLVFITQHPKLIDSFVRRLVNTHEHLLNVFGKPEANLYTWIQCCEEPESKSQRMTADKKRWKYPTEVYETYKSAELHTRKPHTPRMVKIGRYALIGFVLFAIVAIGILYRTYHGTASASRSDAPHATQSAKHEPDAESTGIFGVRRAQEKKPLTKAEYVERNIPRVQGMPWSAPIFDEQKVAAKPEIYCMAIPEKNECRCYSEQMTRMQINLGVCLTIVRDGVYNPFREPVRDMLVTDKREQPSVVKPDVQTRSKSDSPLVVQVMTQPQPKATDVEKHAAF